MFKCFHWYKWIQISIELPRVIVLTNTRYTCIFGSCAHKKNIVSLLNHYTDSMLWQDWCKEAYLTCLNGQDITIPLLTDHFNSFSGIFQSGLVMNHEVLVGVICLLNTLHFLIVCIRNPFSIKGAKTFTSQRFVIMCTPIWQTTVHINAPLFLEILRMNPICINIFYMEAMHV